MGATFKANNLSFRPSHNSTEDIIDINIMAQKYHSESTIKWFIIICVAIAWGATCFAVFEQSYIEVTLMHMFGLSSSQYSYIIAMSYYVALIFLNKYFWSLRIISTIISFTISIFILYLIRKHSYLLLWIIFIMDHTFKTIHCWSNYNFNINHIYVLYIFYEK